MTYSAVYIFVRPHYVTQLSPSAVWLELQCLMFFRVTVIAPLPVVLNIWVIV
jgi:hypothetical protein